MAKEAYKDYKKLKKSGVDVNVYNAAEEDRDVPVNIYRTPAPTPEVEEPLFKFDTSEAPQARPEEPSDDGWKEALLYGATPMLVSLLAGGGVGPGAEVGGKYLLDNEKRKQEFRRKSFLEKLKERRMASQRQKPQVINYEDDQGVTRVGVLSKDGQSIVPVNVQGKEGPAAKGYKYSIVKDEATGKKYTISGSGTSRGETSGIPQAVPFTKPSGQTVNIGPKQVDYVAKVADNYKASTKNWEGNVQALDEAYSVINNPKTGALGSKVALRKIMRTVESRISNEDAKYYGDSWSLFENLKRRLEALKTDKIPENLKTQVMEVLRDLRNKTQNKIKDVSNEYINRAVTGRNVDRDYAKMIILGGKRFQPLKESPKTKKKSIKKLSTEELLKRARGK
jgi:hypothetical protein